MGARKGLNTKGEDTMAVAAQNYVYEVKTKKDVVVKEPVASKELLELCKKIADKYPLKK